MVNPLEQFPRYSEERATNEAHKMKKKIENGEAASFIEAEKLVELEKMEKNPDFTKAEDQEIFENFPENKKRELIGKAWDDALQADKKHDLYESIRRQKYKRQGEYDNHIYETIAKVFKEKGVLKRNLKKRILGFHQLPPEALYVVNKLKEAGISVDDIPPKLFEEVFRRAASLIDRKNEYDKELAQKIGHQDLMRWRNNEKMENGDSFKKIIETLRDHAIVKTPKTKIGQQPRVTFKPKGNYHEDENL